jgi:hypothetical protein
MTHERSSHRQLAILSLQLYRSHTNEDDAMQGPTRSMTLDELKTYTGKEVGVSEWFTLDQDRINRFADVTRSKTSW